MKVSYYIASMMIISCACVFADGNDSKGSSFKFNQSDDNGYWDTDAIGNLAEAIANLKKQDLRDLKALYAGSLQGTASERLTYKWALLDATEDKLIVFEAQFEGRADEDFERLDKNDQIKAHNIIEKLTHSSEEDLDSNSAFSKGLETWLILQGKINATKASIELIEDAKASLPEPDTQQLATITESKGQFDNYPVTTLIITGSLFSLPEKYQKKIIKFLENGAKKEQIEDLLDD